MQVLVPMSAQAFERYLDSAVATYAEENTRSGRWSAIDAPGLSRDAFATLLPDGVATKNNYLFEIHAPDVDDVVGALWLAVEERAGVRSGFIYDVGVHAAYRRRGYAKRAFEALEIVARELHLSAIGLHVFAHNANAQALYRSLGYQVTGINMQKKLNDPQTAREDQAP